MGTIVQYPYSYTRKVVRDSKYCLNYWYNILVGHNEKLNCERPEYGAVLIMRIGGQITRIRAVYKKIDHISSGIPLLQTKFAGKFVLK